MIRHWLFVFIWLVLALYGAPACAQAEQVDSTQDPSKKKGALFFYLENDFFGGTDRHYTNALKFSYLTADLNTPSASDTAPGKFGDALDDVGDMLQNKLLSRRFNLGFSLGQNIYTPENTDEDRLILDDRPYAAWLYGALALHAKTPDKMDVLELGLGVVGPAALGRQTQNTVHKIINDDLAQGWENQLANEPGIALTWLRIWRPEGGLPGEDTNWDILPRVGVTLGNVFTFANAGAEVRLGYNLPSDFGTSRIRPGGGVQTPVEDGSAIRKKRTSVYLFGDVDGRFVARNIFMDGNIFAQSHNVKKENFVADLSFGLAARINKVRLSYSLVFRTDEFREQGGDGQFFGSLGFGYHF